MDLDELKELDKKAAPGKLLGIRPDCSHIEQDASGEDVLDDGDWVVTRFIIEGEKENPDMEDADADLLIALWNSRKEMISTIERYKAALEAVDKESRNGNQLSLNKRLIAIDEITEEALKDPKKTPYALESQEEHMTEFEEFETPAILKAMQVINLRVTGDMKEGKADADTIAASQKMGRMLEEVVSRPER